MPRIIDLRRLKKFETLSGLKLRATSLDQGDPTDTAQKTHGYGQADRPRSDDRDLNLRGTALG
jgi:hypothetical protein